MISDPPLDDGAVHDTDTCLLPVVPTTSVGATGGAFGVTSFDGTEYSPVPAALTAATLNVTFTPRVRPVTVVVRLVDSPSSNVVHSFSIHDCTTKSLTAAPLVLGRSHDTATCPTLSATATTFVGAPGRVRGTA